MTWPGADFPSRFLLVALTFFYGAAILRGFQLKRICIRVEQPTLPAGIIDRVADGLNRIVPTLRSFEIIAFAWPLPFHLFPACLRISWLNLPLLKWVGVITWCGALLIYLWAQMSMGDNWRIGLQTDAQLVTHGAFAWSRHPIYVGFAMMAMGTFCVFPNGGFFLLAAASVALLQRQAAREEKILLQHYGQPYADYCRHARRWFGPRR